MIKYLLYKWFYHWKCVYIYNYGAGGDAVVEWNSNDEVIMIIMIIISILYNMRSMSTFCEVANGW